MSADLDLAASPERARDDLLLEPADAVGLVRDGATVAVGGSGSLLQVPETLLAALGARWESTRTPADLTVLHVMGLGDHLGRGIDHVAQAGLVRRFIGSHFVLSPREQNLIARDEVEAIGLPAGTITLLYREIAAGRPGLFTDIGLDTWVDPRLEGGRMNARATELVNRVVTVQDREWLFYPAFPIDVALLRASSADELGNLGMDDEAAFSDNLAIAQAVHNSGGLVIAEVKRIEPAGAIPAARVRVPAALIDHVVLTDFPQQTPTTVEDARRTGATTNRPTAVPPLALDHRAVVARRAMTELHEGDLANLGVGMANGISYVALEEGQLGRFTLSVEQGVFGGLPGVGLESGTAVNPSAIIDMTAQFDLYDGGALDFAGLAFAEVDRTGDVNVAAVGGVPIGPGGFIDISQKARTVVFCGSLRGGGLRTRVEDGRLDVLAEGRYPKFVDRVDRVAFSAARALRTGQHVRYVTERAVFGLGPDGLELLEVAPGLDVERDVIAAMGFRPVVPRPPIPMDRRLFLPGPAGLAVLPPRTRRTAQERSGR